MANYWPWPNPIKGIGNLLSGQAYGAGAPGDLEQLSRNISAPQNMPPSITGPSPGADLAAQIAALNPYMGTIQVPAAGAPPAPSGGGAISGSASFGGGGGSGMPSLPSGLSAQFAPLDKQSFAPAYTPDPMEYAKLLTDLQYNTAESGINRAIDLSKTQGERGLRDLEEFIRNAIGTQQQYGGIADEQLQSIYAALQNELQAGQGQMANIYGGGANAIGAAYDEAGAAVGSSADQIARSLQQYSGGLGLEDALRDPMAQLQAQTAAYQAETAAGKAPAVANIQGLGTQMQGIGQLGMNQSRQELAQRRAGVAEQVLGTIGQIQMEGAKGQRSLLEGMNDQIFELSGQLADLGSERGLALRAAYEDAMTARSGAERQAKLDNLTQQIELGQLELAQKGYGLDVAALQQKAANDAAQLAISRASAARADKADPLGDLKTQAEIANIYSQIEERGQTKTPESGYAAAQAVAQRLGFGPGTREALSTSLAEGDPTESMITAQEEVLRRGWKPSDLARLQEAISAYYGIGL